jgi:hypothetical protein
MGRDEMSVVDGDLRVYGVDSLRVADGSIMPRVTTGNTMAPCVIIGERAAEIIRDEHQIGTVSASRSDRFHNNPEHWVQSRSPRHNFTSTVRFTDLGWKSRESPSTLQLSVPELDSKKEASRHGEHTKQTNGA